jgi:hypothetical protein
MYCAGDERVMRGAARCATLVEASGRVEGTGNMQPEEQREQVWE